MNSQYEARVRAEIKAFPDKIKSEAVRYKTMKKDKRMLNRRWQDKVKAIHFVIVFAIGAGAGGAIVLAAISFSN